MTSAPVPGFACGRGTKTVCPLCCNYFSGVDSVLPANPVATPTPLPYYLDVGPPIALDGSEVAVVAR